jgi:hypothetical protein
MTRRAWPPRLYQSRETAVLKLSASIPRPVVYYQSCGYALLLSTSRYRPMRKVIHSHVLETLTPLEGSLALFRPKAPAIL